MNTIQSVSLLRTLSLGVVLGFSIFGLSASAAPSDISAAFQTKGDLYGQINFVEISSSSLFAEARKNFSDPKMEALQTALGIKDSDLQSIAFSISSLSAVNPDTGESESRFSGIMQISKPLTIDQISSALDAHNNKNPREPLLYKADQNGGMKVLRLNQVAGQPEFMVGAVPHMGNQQTLLLIANPTEFSELARRRTGTLPGFVNSGRETLSFQPRSWMVIKVDDAMRAGMKYATESGTINQTSPFPIPPTLQSGLAELEMISIGVDTNHVGAFEIMMQAPASTARTMHEGMANFAAMMQMAILFSQHQDPNSTMGIQEARGTGQGNNVGLRLNLKK